MLVLVLDGESTLVARHAGQGRQLAARMLSGRIDRQLAGGASPESSVLRAVRAQQLVRAPMRQELADSLWQLADEATGSAEHTANRVPMDWGALRAVAAELRTLAARLLAFAPMPARGVAQVNVLLTDGGGPLYSPDSIDNLRAAINEAANALDPLSAY